MNGALVSIVRYTFLQQFRNRLYLVVLFFGALLLAASLLFGAVAADQELRVILDLGLATAEFFGLVTALFGAVTLILEEMESRTIYLILTRPLPRPVYILGRSFGLLAAVAASVGAMAVLLALLLWAKGGAPGPEFYVAIPFILLKIGVVTALAVFFSLFSSSAAASVVFTFFFWVLGHFGRELRFLAEKSGGAAEAGLKALLLLVPDLARLNYRDFLHAPDAGGFASAALYAVVYSAACFCLSAALFSRKEF
jgi:ABC-type transport system involved in multi-copper enzyme maturation permease subunit